MGTYYRVTVVRRPPALDANILHAAARGELQRVEDLMSAYRPDSDVGRFNAAADGEWVGVSPETLRCVELALEVGRRSSGAYDITAGPLVNLWGFGPGRTRSDLPSEAEITAARARVGLHLLELRRDPPAIRKLRAEVAIDLASVAKGLAVDATAEALQRRGVRDYCVDVGGEVRTRGHNVLGRPWQVAIEAPIVQETCLGGAGGTHKSFFVRAAVGGSTDKNELVGATPNASSPGPNTPSRGPNTPPPTAARTHSAAPSAPPTLVLRDLAIATSGDYRIYLEHEGVRYPHILDPRTGRPINNAVASVTVADSSCARADAWATALMVLGPQEGLQLAEQQGLAAMFIIRAADDITQRAATSFRRLL
jgi:FAD:protein FMN transferase